MKVKIYALLTLLMCLNFGCASLGQDVPITLFDPDVQKLTVTVNGVSAAMQRFKMDDENNEFYTLFRYRPVKGLGPEPGRFYGPRECRPGGQAGQYRQSLCRLYQ